MAGKTGIIARGWAAGLLVGAGCVGVGCAQLLDFESFEYFDGDGVGGGSSSSGLGGAASSSSGSGSSSGGSGGVGGAGGMIVGPQSCKPGLNDMCFDNGVTADCCETFAVPSGPDAPCSMTVNAFNLDAYEVTVGRFKEFLEKGYPTTKPSYWSSYMWEPDKTALAIALTNCGGVAPPASTWTLSAGDMNFNRPINCVTWAEAREFCKWDGGRLPTQVELRYAAQGGIEAREYPWMGTVLDTDHATFMYANASMISSVGFAYKGEAKWGQYDLVGNVREWVAGIDCNAGSDVFQNPQATFGGCFNSGQMEMKSLASPKPVAPDQRSDEVGFRCARDLP